MLCNDMDDTETAAFMAKLGGDHWPACSYQETHWQIPTRAEVPVSYITCLQDNILPVNWQQTFAQRFHAGSTVSIDAGHQAMNTCPAELAALLLYEASKF